MDATDMTTHQTADTAEIGIHRTVDADEIEIHQIADTAEIEIHQIADTAEIEIRQIVDAAETEICQIMDVTEKEKESGNEIEKGIEKEIEMRQTADAAEIVICLITDIIEITTPLTLKESEHGKETEMTAGQSIQKDVVAVPLTTVMIMNVLANVNMIIIRQREKKRFMKNLMNNV